MGLQNINLGKYHRIILAYELVQAIAERNASTKFE